MLVHYSGVPANALTKDTSISNNVLFSYALYFAVYKTIEL